jgi:hypothetical protein
MGGWIIGTVWLFYLLGALSRVIDFIAWTLFRSGVITLGIRTVGQTHTHAKSSLAEPTDRCHPIANASQGVCAVCST